MEKNKVNALFDTIDHDLRQIAHGCKDSDTTRQISALQHKISAERSKLNA